MGWYIYKKHSRPVHSGEERGRRRFDGSCAGRRWEGDEKRSGKAEREDKGRAPFLDTSTRICTGPHQSQDNFTPLQLPTRPIWQSNHPHQSPPLSVSAPFSSLRAFCRSFQASPARPRCPPPSPSSPPATAAGSHPARPPPCSVLQGAAAVREPSERGIRPICFRCILGRVPSEPSAPALN